MNTERLNTERLNTKQLSCDPKQIELFLQQTLDDDEDSAMAIDC